MPAARPDVREHLRQFSSWQQHSGSNSLREVAAEEATATCCVRHRQAIRCTHVTYL